MVITRVAAPPVTNQVDFDGLIRRRAVRRKQLQDAGYVAWCFQEDLNQARTSAVVFHEGESITTLEQRSQRAEQDYQHLRARLIQEDTVDARRACVMTLREFRRCIGAEDASAFALAVTKLTGVHITSQLIYEAERYEGREKRVPMARPKAEAIAKYLSAEMGRTISIDMIDGLKVV